MNHKKNKAGFSLIEVIIAFSILTITVVASTSLIANSIRANQDNILRVQAYFLAQEGLELARNQRDTNWLQNKQFDNGISKSQTITAIKDPQTNQYTFQEASNNENQTVFTRTITVEPLSHDKQPILVNDIQYKNSENKIPFDQFAKEITSKVTYGTNHTPETNKKSITLKTVLTNWKQ